MLLRLISHNLWIWPCLYAINSKSIIKGEKRQDIFSQEESTEQFTPIGAQSWITEINRSTDFKTLESMPSNVSDLDISSGNDGSLNSKKIVISELGATK